jgi:hypothetical protein
VAAKVGPILTLLLGVALVEGLASCVLIRRCPATFSHGKPLLSVLHVRGGDAPPASLLEIFNDGVITMQCSPDLRFCGRVGRERLEPIRKLIRAPEFLELAKSPAFREEPCCDFERAYIQVGETRFVVGVDSAPPLVWRLFAQLDFVFGQEFGSLYRCAAISLNH